MPALQRPLTVVLSVTRNGRPKEDELLAELVKYVDKEDIKAMQCHSGVQSNLIQEGEVFVVTAQVISKMIVKMKLFVTCVDKLVI